MQAVILAGGLGTRLREETDIRPKPMVDIGGRPILWHIMNIYAAHGIRDFIVCLGYKGYMIKEYFANYFLHVSDVTFDMSTGSSVVHHNNAEPWRVTLVDTGDAAMTGGRLKMVGHHITGDTFCMTYGDGVGNIDISDLLKFHASHGRLATMTATRPPARFGALRMGEDNQVLSFEEKPLGDNAYINGGFFALSRRVLNYIDGPSTIWEHEPLEKLTREGNLMAYRHDGFWHPMDTIRDKQHLEELWSSGKAPWRIW